jgi:hypothetical protein
MESTVSSRSTFHESSVFQITGKDLIRMKIYSSQYGWRSHVSLVRQIAAVLLLAVACPRAEAEQRPEYGPVLSMNPAGFWPLDEGRGEMVHDRSVNANHGKIRHVAWDPDTGLIDFVGRYQWLEIPADKAYQTSSFSMGGWVFLRSEVVGSAWVNRQGMVLIGNRFKWGRGNTAGLQLCIRKQEVIDVVSDSMEDVLGTRLYMRYKDDVRVERAYGQPNLALGQWHHLLYTFESGRGSLYLNGTLIASKDGIKYRPVNTSLQIGNDAMWWHQQSGKSGSLDGSVRNMVWFERALSSAEVFELHNITRPQTQPWVSDDTTVVLDGRRISFDDLPGLAPEALRRVLELYGEKPARTLKELSGALLPVLKDALNCSACRLPAVKVLVQINDDAARAVLKEALPGLLSVVQAENIPEGERAEAVLALAAMKQDAAAAVPLFTETLTQILDREGARLPHVEDLLRNALIRALWDIAPDDIHARRLLGRAFAEPLLNVMDLSIPEFEAVRAQLAQGDSMMALETFGTLRPATLGERFFTFKESGKDGDYTATARFNGSTYKVGTGIAWEGVEKVPVDEFKAIVAELGKDYPGAKSWRKPDFEHLYRVPITKISPDGSKQTLYLEGENFIMDGNDAKCRAWSIFVDELGYIHLIGGQHNTPNPDYFIPGSWEKMGAGRNKGGDDFPRQLYWVSAQPECIDSFEFVGQRSSSRAIPADYLNYMNILQSFEHKTSLYGRVDVYGWQSWGMFRYDAYEKKWSSVGGDPYYVMESARRRDPEWLNYLHDNMRGGVPKTPGDARCLVWAWQPAFYNFCRDDWGARFDKTGRLHVHMRLSGLDQHGYNRLASAYAWSDDNGETFHRADGSPVKLPLTVNPAPEHNAERGANKTSQWWALWFGLLSQAGCK